MNSAVQPNRIQLHIDELVLDGFAPQDRYPISRALEAELARLLALPDGWPSLANRQGDIGNVAGGRIDVPQGASPEAIGAQIAGSLYRSMSS